MSILSATQVDTVKNYVGGEWKSSQSAEFINVVNPATQKILAAVPASDAAEVNAAIAAASKAFPAWRATPPEDRIQYLFKLKQLLEEHFDEIARITTTENGKTLTEARAELRRGIENVEVACGIPTLMQGYNLEDVARGIDEIMIRQPLGVVAAITPFNFPAMIPFWFLPYAIACGNTFILKPSEKVPLTMQRVFELVDTIGLPPGVLNLVNGTKTAVNVLLEHPDVRAISFVGSTPVARYIYAHSAEVRQARAVPGRSEESCCSASRRGYGYVCAGDLRERVRMRRPAMPGGVSSSHSWRRAKEVPRLSCRSCAFVTGWLRSGRSHRDGSRDHSREQAAD